MQRLPARHQHAVSEVPISSREPPAPQDWLSVQDTVRQLYVVQKLPLKDVKHILDRDYGFRNASERMFKSRLKAWGYLKNAKKDDWGALAILHQRRKTLGKKNTVFTVRGRERSVKDLNKYIRSLNLTEDEFLASIQEQEHDIPEYIRARTPDLTTVAKESPSSSSEHGCKTPSPRIKPELSFDDPASSSPHLQFDLSRRSRVKTEDYYASPHIPVAPHSWCASSRDRFQVVTTASESPYTTSASISCSSSERMALPCDQLQRGVEAMGSQMISPAPLKVRYGYDDIEAWTLVNARPLQSPSSSAPDIEFLCSRCQQPPALHFASLDTLACPNQQSPQPRSILNPTDSISAETTTSPAWQVPASTRENEGACKWCARCFLACILLSRGDYNASRQIQLDAANEFEKMLNNEDPMLLTAAQQVVNILTMHDQGDIAQTIMQSSYSVCERRLPSDHPVRVLMALWTTVAKEDGLKGSDISSSHLYEVYKQFMGRLGDRHPYTIAASYAYGWTLKYEEHHEDAEHWLKQTYDTSRSVFGPEHMQSIFSLAATAGAQQLQGKREEAMHNFERVIKDAGLVLGKSHPYTLEGKRRLAKLIRESEIADGLELPGQRVEELYWEVLVGRVKSLGRGHEYTQAMRIDYEQLCDERGVWEDRERSILVLFREDENLAERQRRSPSPTGSDISAHEAY